MSHKKRINDRPIIVTGISDTHSGSTIGLNPPRILLDDGGEYVASKEQRWLWRYVYQDVLARTEQAAITTKAQGIIGVVCGDLVEGIHHGTTQLISHNETTMQRIAAEALTPFANLVDELYLIRGTETHVGASAKLEEKIAGDFTNTVPESDARMTWWHLPLRVSGTTFDISHQGNIGRMYHTRPGPALNAARELIEDYRRTGHKPPDFVLRGHFHTWVDTHDLVFGLRWIGLPAMSLCPAYIYRTRPAAMPDLGGVVFTVWPDRTDVLKLDYKPTRRAYHEVQLNGQCKRE